MNNTILIDGNHYHKDRPASCRQVLTFKKLKKLMETPPQVDRNRTPPPCRICPFYQPSFRYQNKNLLVRICPEVRRLRRPVRSRFLQ